MKNSLTVLVASLTVIAGCKNSGTAYFTGTIDYNYTYTSDSLNTDSLSLIRPSKSNFRYDNNDYQSRFIGKDTEIYYYSGQLNKCIGKSSSQKNYDCEDYNLITDSVLSFKLYNTDEKILGYSCKILEIQKKNSWTQYYISKDLIISPTTYNKHKSYNWDFYGEKAGGGLILKSEHRFKHFTMKGMATDVTKQSKQFKALEIDEKLFSVLCK